MSQEDYIDYLYFNYNSKGVYLVKIANTIRIQSSLEVLWQVFICKSHIQLNNKNEFCYITMFNLRFRISTIYLQQSDSDNACH